MDESSGCGSAVGTGKQSWVINDEEESAIDGSDAVLGLDGVIDEAVLAVEEGISGCEEVFSCNLDGLVADSFISDKSTTGCGIDGEIAVLHELSKALVDCPHVAIKLLIRWGWVAVREEDYEVVVRALADNLYIVLDLH